LVLFGIMGRIFDKIRNLAGEHHPRQSVTGNYGKHWGETTMPRAVLHTDAGER